MTTYRALTDSDFIEGLSWLQRVNKEITIKALGEYQLSYYTPGKRNEYYEITFPSGTNGKTLLDVVDCVIAYEEVDD